MTLMIVGSLNRENPYFQGARGTGLSVYRFDEETAATELLHEMRGVDNPTFFSVSPTGRHVYANSEVYGWAEGRVAALELTAQTGRLRAVNTQPSLGSITAYNSFDAAGRFLLVANYGLGAEDEGPNQAIAVYPIGADGSLAPPISSVAHHGHGPNAERQERPHPHCVRVTPDNRFVVVADLGLDALFTYPFDPSTGLLGEPVQTTLPSGSGPRHLIFHPNGRLAFVSCELNSTVLSLAYDPATGRFDLLDTARTVPEGVTGSYCADIQLHPRGHILYISNRGHDSVAVVAVDVATGRLTPVACPPCGGLTPRNLAVDPSGRFLAVANQNGDCVAFFAIDPVSGLLSEARAALTLGTPMCIGFTRAS
jgi:6-phosphogluconolactonase